MVGLAVINTLFTDILKMIKRSNITCCNLRFCLSERAQLFFSVFTYGDLEIRKGGILCMNTLPKRQASSASGVNKSFRDK